MIYRDSSNVSIASISRSRVHDCRQFGRIRLKTVRIGFSNSQRDAALHSCLLVAPRSQCLYIWQTLHFNIIDQFFLTVLVRAGYLRPRTILAQEHFENHSVFLLAVRRRTTQLHCQALRHAPSEDWFYQLFPQSSRWTFR